MKSDLLHVHRIGQSLSCSLEADEEKPLGKNGMMEKNLMIEKWGEKRVRCIGTHK